MLSLAAVGWQGRALFRVALALVGRAEAVLLDTSESSEIGNATDALVLLQAVAAGAAGAGELVREAFATPRTRVTPQQLARLRKTHAPFLDNPSATAGGVEAQ
ncbi:hypothetical protein T484DRAFT_1907249, partial [Baffinella frigidus]